MKLSIVVCTRNRARQLEACLDHVARLSCAAPWELIVVNNGSSDETAEVLRRRQDGFLPRLTALEEPRPGLGRARNRGWRAAAGELIAFTDDDCYPADDYLNQIVACFEDPMLGFLGGRILLFDPSDYPITIQTLEHRVEIAPSEFLPAGLVHGANFAFRREVLQAIGGFDDDFGAGTSFACEDVDALARAAARGWRGAYDPRPLVYHHHQRKTRHEAMQLRRGYDVARGAYYMKSVLDPTMRRRYLSSWVRRLLGQRPRRTVRELRGALGYLRARRQRNRTPAA